MRAKLRLSFDWKAQDGYYYGKNGIVGPYHKGRDFVRTSALTGHDVYVGDTAIGKIGKTGLAGGVHVHVQAGRDFYAQNPINPQPYEFKPGEVVQVGTASAWGNYVIVKTNGVYVVYAHFAKVYVKPGDIIKEEQMLSTSFIKDMYHAVAARKPSKSEITFHSSKSTAHGLLRGFIDNNDLAWKKKDAVIENQNKALVEKDKIIAQIRKAASEAQGELKDDLETANQKILSLTEKVEQMNKDLEEANKQAGESARSWWNRLFDAINRLIGGK